MSFFIKNPIGGGGNGDGNIAIEDATIATKGIVQLNNTLTSTSISQAVTAAKAKELNDNITSHIAIKATDSQLGHVQPDGKTILADANGVLSAVGTSIVVSNNTPASLTTGGLWYQIL